MINLEELESKSQIKFNENFDFIKSTQLLEWGWCSACFGNNKFVVVSDNGLIAYSEDAINFKTIKDYKDLYSWSKIIYDGNKFIINGCKEKFSVYYRVTAYSTDGINWEIVDKEEERVKTLFYGNGKLITLDFNNQINTFDGINWNNGYISGRFENWTKFAYGKTVSSGERFVAVSYGGKIAYSPDGIDFSRRGEEIGFGTYVYVRDIKFGDNKFVVVGEDGLVAVSEDGVFFKIIRLVESNSKKKEEEFRENIKQLCYCNNIFVAVSDFCVIYSEDGINWTKSVISYDSERTAITYGNNKFLVVSYNGETAYFSTENFINKKMENL